MPLGTSGTIGQIVAASYPAVLDNMRKPHNQWSESAFMRALEKLGAIKRKSLGPTIEVPIDWQANDGATFLTTDLDDLGLTKTDVIDGASYAIAQLAVPIVWSEGDEAKNPSDNQKVAFVSSLLSNGIESHDDLIEQALFTGTSGFVGLDTMVTNDGTGTIGGINAATDVMWKNQRVDYTNGTDIEAAMTSLFNACSKGSGSKLAPKLIVGGSAVVATYEGALQAFQRFTNGDKASGGFEYLAFHNAMVVFSQYAPSSNGPMYFLNPTSFQLIVSKQKFRSRTETAPIPNAAGYTCKIYSACQAVTTNRSRLGYLGTNV